MSKTTITYQPKGEDKKPNGPAVKAVVDIKVGTDLASFVKLYGEKVAYVAAAKAIKVMAGDQGRRLLAIGKSPEEVAEYLTTSWKPTEHLGRQKKTDEEKLMDLFAKLTPEQQAAIRSKMPKK